MSLIETYINHPCQRTRTTLVIEDDLTNYVRRRPVEVLRGVDANGDWLFGFEFRQVNGLTLVKLLVLSDDETTIKINSVALNQFPKTMDLTFTVNNFAGREVGQVLATFGDVELELETMPRRLMELRTLAPEGRELISPWMSLALTA